MNLGYGYGSGYGIGSGIGSGSGYGSGSGSGDGYNGSGDGSGDGYNGSGDGCGSGDGSGYGSRFAPSLKPGGAVKIGCTTLTPRAWLEQGEELARANNISESDIEDLRALMEQLVTK